MTMNHPQLSEAMAQAQALARSARLAEAEAAFRNIIAAYPQFHPAYLDLGLLAYGAGNLLMAAGLFKKAISLDRNIALYHRNYGEICRRLGRFDEAIAAGSQACRLAPFDIDAHFNLGMACSDVKDNAAATHAYCRVLELLDLRLASGNITPRLWNMRGVSLRWLNRFDEARKCFEQALELQPDFPEGLNCLGSLLNDTGLTQEARKYFAKAVDIAPGFSIAQFNLGMAQLKLGDWERGWENYEMRWAGSAESGKGAFSRPPCPLPQWDGHKETERQGLLVYAEQGFGDLLQFARYLTLASQIFAKVGFVCPEQSAQLLTEWSFGEHVVLLKRMPVDHATWHWQCPLMSLPRAFRTRTDTVPASVPYLKVPKVAQAHWRERLDEAGPERFRVGVAWAGRRVHQYDAQRSMKFEQFLPLLKDRRISWVSLQKLEPGETHPAVPDDVNWIDWTEELTDFADTAGLVSNLDLVISIDSSMVHLAGGLARPVWMMNRYAGEWRWMEHRNDSPWYPTLRIFNQPQYGDWASVIEAVRSALAEMIITTPAA